MIRKILVYLKIKKIISEFKDREKLILKNKNNKIRNQNSTTDFTFFHKILIKKLTKTYFFLKFN
jgi:hypothetical protein